MRKYIDLNTIYNKELLTETYKINTIKLSVNEVKREFIRNMRDYWLVQGLKPDFDYVRLIKREGGIMMSDTPMERNTNEGFLRNANGDVIVFGLGLGLIIFPLLNDENVKSITVVELYQDLIDVVEPYIKDKDVYNKVSIVQGDCFTYDNLPKGKKFDTIYFDIWISIVTDNYEEQNQLHKKYRKYLNKDNPNCFIDSWMRNYYKKEIAKEKSEEKRRKAYY